MNDFLTTDDFYCDYVFSGKTKVKKLLETDNLLSFYHTRPSYQVHIVIVPKEHISNLSEVDDLDLIKDVFKMARSIIKNLKLDKKYYKIIVNGGGFQDSKHLHFHLVSGEKFKND